MSMGDEEDARMRLWLVTVVWVECEATTVECIEASSVEDMQRQLGERPEWFARSAVCENGLRWRAAA